MILLGICFSLVLPAVAKADIEVVGVFGGLIGSSIDTTLQGDFSLDDAPLYGVRAGWSGPLIGVDGSIVTSPSGLDLVAEGIPINVDARVTFYEANFYFAPIPGPISPFVTAGIGIHSFHFDVDAGGFGALEASVKKSGYNFGAGFKATILKVVVRGDIRDHVTDIGPDDFELGGIAGDLGFDEDVRLHNVEISFGAGISF